MHSLLEFPYSLDLLQTFLHVSISLICEATENGIVNDGDGAVMASGDDELASDSDYDVGDDVVKH
jgi:hypothetical protein